MYASITLLVEYQDALSPRETGDALSHSYESLDLSQLKSETRITLIDLDMFIETQLANIHTQFQVHVHIY